MSSVIGVDTVLVSMIVMGGGVWPDAVEAARSSARAAENCFSSLFMLRFPEMNPSPPGIQAVSSRNITLLPLSDCQTVSQAASGLAYAAFSHTLPSLSYRPQSCLADAGARAHCGSTFDDAKSVVRYPHELMSFGVYGSMSCNGPCGKFLRTLIKRVS